MNPADGRLPSLTPAARMRMKSTEAQRLALVRRWRAPAEGPEDMDLGDRCLVYRPFPVVSSGYNDQG